MSEENASFRNIIISLILGLTGIASSVFFAGQIHDGRSLIFFGSGLTLFLIGIWPLLYKEHLWDYDLPRWIVKLNSWVAFSITIAATVYGLIETQHLVYAIVLAAIYPAVSILLLWSKTSDEECDIFIRQMNHLTH